MIVEVDRKPVQSAADVQKALSSVPKGQDALVLVWSNGGNTFRVLHAAEAGQETAACSLVRIVRFSPGRQAIVPASPFFTSGRV